MKLYSEGKNYKLYQGNMLDMLDVIEENSIDAIVTDPPYELGFMGKSWDKSGIAFQKETWEKCLRVLKPGGHLLAFGAPRLYHRLACAIEDAGFEIRDSIFWLFGSGMPKSLNIGLSIDKKMGVESIDTGIVSQNARPNSNKSNTLYESGTVGKTFTIKKANNEWDGWGTQLKPSYEPIILAQKPIEGTFVDNVLKYGVGGINIDECRIAFNGDKWKTQRSGKTSRAYQSEATTTAGGLCEANENGRFPANTILTYDDNDYDEVCDGFPNVGQQSKNGTPYNYVGKEYNNKDSSMFNGDKPKSPSNYNDSGSASRYFYCAKASKRDRNEGLPNDSKNTHTTVKPVSLMQYLIRLVTPNGGVVLDPFNGSGSTGKAVMWENRDNNKNYSYIGIELTEEYLPIAKARIEYSQTCKEEPEKNTKSKSKVKEIKKNTNKLF